MLRFLMILVAAVLAAAGGVLAQRPNVVMIIGDDQAFGDFGFMGHEVIQTPHLDQLAREGALFPRGYVPTALCRPSLASLATGRWPHRHGITGNDPRRGQNRQAMVDLFKQSPTVPAILGKLGYRSLQTGKWWEGNYAVGGFTEGMTHGDVKRGGRHGDVGLQIGRQGLQRIFDFIGDGKGDPFFLWYAPFLPHTPHNPPARLLKKYATPGRSKFVAKYYAMCEWFDETCGELLGHLKKKGLEDNTIVLFVTDNGWIQNQDRNGYAPRSKRSPNEGGIRTPIIVKWPAKIAPRRVATPISSIDLVPTLLKACGAEVPATADGVDLMPLCTGASTTRRPVFGAALTHDVVDLGHPERSLQARWVVDGRWKLIAPNAGAARPQLYDLAADPHENQDLAGQHPERVQALRDRLDAWWPVARASRPNILLVVTDDQRHDMMGCAGHPVLQTPTMDRLARGGVRFTNAFVTTAICAASRATIFTGLYRRTHGYTFKTPPLARRFTESSYPRILRSAGYRTGFVGKFGVRVAANAQRRMFDVFRPSSHPYLKKRPDGTTQHLTDMVADQAVEFLRETPGTQPFCLSVSFHAPHAEDANPKQYIWPPSVDGLYRDAEVPVPPLAGEAFFSKQPAFLRESMGRIRWKWRFDTPEKRVAMTRGYYRMISGVDQALQRILAEVERQGQADHTVVIFIGDNGYFVGERGFAGKWFIYEPSIRVPLIVFDPRLPAARRGQTVAQMALNVDVPATVLQVAGIPVPPAWQGASLLPLVRGEQPEWRRDFFYEHLFDNPTIPKSEGVRGERFKYVRYFEQQPVYEELFDLQEDPLETDNLVADPAHAATLGRLRKRTDALRDGYAGR